MKLQDTVDLMQASKSNVGQCKCQGKCKACMSAKKVKAGKKAVKKPKKFKAVKDTVPEMPDRELGISQTQMKRLQYRVNTPASVSYGSKTK